jgi:hypothetical protein
VKSEGAVGKENVPRDLDKETLRNDIAEAYLGRKHAFDLFEGSKARTRLKHLGRIRKTIEKLAVLLKDDFRADAMIAELAQLPVPQPMQNPARSIVPFIDQVKHASENLEKAQERIAEKWHAAHKRDPRLRGRRVTEKEWLAGVSLPFVFEGHFRRRAGRSRSMGKPSGPMVGFIRTTMKELGLPYSDEAITRAFSLRMPLRDAVLPMVLRQISDMGQI